jgi:hypothetical protein
VPVGALAGVLRAHAAPRPRQRHRHDARLREPSDPLADHGHEWPERRNPTGRVSAFFDGFGPYLDGPVTCLSVHDNVAVLQTQDSLMRLPIAYRITDNEGLGVPDVVEAAYANPGFSDCRPEFSYIRTDRVTSGDIVVVDVPPLPTSKEEYKDGGWRAFSSAFSNQGQCVASVQRGPKPS